MKRSGSAVSISFSNSKLSRNDSGGRTSLSTRLDSPVARSHICIASVPSRPSSDPLLSRARDRWIILGITLGTLPIIIAFIMMRRHWTSVPYGDEWWTPGKQIVAFSRGGLSISDLWSQHNESRKFFPCLYYLALVW